MQFVMPITKRGKVCLLLCLTCFFFGTMFVTDPANYVRPHTGAPNIPDVAWFIQHPRRTTNTLEFCQNHFDRIQAAHAEQACENAKMAASSSSSTE